MPDHEAELGIHEMNVLQVLGDAAGLYDPAAASLSSGDWERDRFLVRSPKTGDRWVPIFPELRPYLEEVFELAQPGAMKIITCKQHQEQNLRTLLCKIILRAGLTVWPKPFHNLRASRETELAAVYPLHVVCDWIGNSTLIAKKHYLQTTETTSGALQKAVWRCRNRCSMQPRRVARIRRVVRKWLKHRSKRENLRLRAKRCQQTQYPDQ